MKHLLLVSDLDHTLLDDRPGVSPENLSAIAAFVAAGGLFTVATGRMPDAIRVFPGLLPYIGLPVVTGNGGQVCDLETGEIFLRRTLPPQVEEIFYALMDAFPLLGAAAYYDLAGFDNLRDSDNIQDLIRREGRPATPRAPRESPKPWNKLLLTQDHAALEAVRLWLTPRLEGLARTVFSEDCFLEILPLGVSKGAALQVILDRAGIAPSAVVAVGDALNDAELLELADVGVAVENACDALKAIADAVVCSNNDHAIRECLARFF